MSGLIISRHAEARMRQRGLQDQDAELARQYGSLISDHGDQVFLLRDRDVEREIRALKQSIERKEREMRDLKQSIERINRLRGRKFVVAGPTLKTACHSGKRDQKRLLRKWRERE
ncbi:MAG: hypothetical protein FJ197_12855 [Gammaproteobacteria bacterium]|nr:hypothetical protein [Gammaproteobacteria bacterium]